MRSDDQKVSSFAGRSLAFVYAYGHERVAGFIDLAWDGDSQALTLDVSVRIRGCEGV